MAMMFFAVVYRGPSLPGEIREWFSVFFEIALSMGLAAIIWNYNKWISSFLILVTVSMFYPCYGLMGYLAGKAVFNGCLWYLFIVMFFSVHNLNTIYKTLRVFAYFHAAIVILQKLGLAGLFSVPHPTGLMANPLEVSALLCFCLPAFLVLKRKSLWLILIPLSGIVIVKQFLGIASLGAGAVFYAVLVYRAYWTIGVVVALSAVWWMFLDAPGIEHRFFVWKKTLVALKQHWIMGSGIGHWKTVFTIMPNGMFRVMEIDGKAWMTTHNDFLQVLFETGIGSVIIFLGYYIDVARKATKGMVLPLTALVIISAYSGCSFPMHIAPTATIAVTWLAVLQIVTDEVGNGQKKLELFL